MYEKAMADVLQRTFEPYLVSGKELSPDEVEKVLAGAVAELLPACVESLGGSGEKALQELGLSLVLEGFDGTRESCCLAAIRVQILNDIFNAMDHMAAELKAQAEAVV